MPVTAASVLDHAMGSLLRLSVLSVVLAGLLFPGKGGKCSSPSHCTVVQGLGGGWVGHRLASKGIVRASCNHSRGAQGDMNIGPGERRRRQNREREIDKEREEFRDK